MYFIFVAGFNSAADEVGSDGVEEENNDHREGEEENNDHREVDQMNNDHLEVVDDEEEMEDDDQEENLDEDHENVVVNYQDEGRALALMAGSLSEQLERVGQVGFMPPQARLFAVSPQPQLGLN